MQVQIEVRIRKSTATLRKRGCTLTLVRTLPAVCIKSFRVLSSASTAADPLMQPVMYKQARELWQEPL